MQTSMVTFCIHEQCKSVVLSIFDSKAPIFFSTIIKRAVTFRAVCDLLDKKANTYFENNFYPVYFRAWHNYIKMFVHYKNALGDI